jgi:hypothetical protein
MNKYFKVSNLIKVSNHKSYIKLSIISKKNQEEKNIFARISNKKKIIIDE